MTQKDALVHLASCTKDRKECSVCYEIIIEHKLLRCKCGNVATKLCDYFICEYGKVTLIGNPFEPDGTPTCDEPLCDKCAVVKREYQGAHIGHNTIDYCKRHYDMYLATNRIYEHRPKPRVLIRGGGNIIKPPLKQ